MAFFAAVVVVCYLVVQFAAPFIPFAWERALTQRFPHVEIDPGSADSATHRYLTSLAARVAEASDLPEDMVITVHYIQGDTVNAFATLGGHIVIFEGLWKLLESENTAAMLIGHEIAHIKNRDPIRGASGALVVSLATGILFGDLGIADIGNLLTAQRFNREQERRADSDAARTVMKLYGHLNGASDLFARL